MLPELEDGVWIYTKTIRLKNGRVKRHPTGVYKFFKRNKPKK